MMNEESNRLPPPPDAFRRFAEAFPALADAWGATQAAGESGPLNRASQRLVKLAIACGSMRRSAVHSAVRKARAVGVTDAEIRQVVTLAAGTLGFPAAVALWQWVGDETDPGE